DETESDPRRALADHVRAVAGEEAVGAPVAPGPTAGDDLAHPFADGAGGGRHPVCHSPRHVADPERRHVGLVQRARPRAGSAWTRLAHAAERGVEMVAPGVEPPVGAAGRLLPLLL